MIPLLILGLCVSIVIKASFKDTSPGREQITSVQGNSVDLTPHLTEFSQLIRMGHRPSQWLINEAIGEAYQKGDWRLVRAIAEGYPSSITEERRKRKTPSEVEQKPEPELETKAEAQKIEEPKQLLFEVQKTSSPIDGVGNDDWRMFVSAAQIEQPSFASENAIGMFRQNKKRLAKLGISEVKNPLEQYDAFEKEVSSLMVEGQELFKQSVAMPIEIDGESHPMTLSGLLAVMRVAGTANAAKWVDSPDERKRFPNTTEAFKRSNGCF